MKTLNFLFVFLNLLLGLPADAHPSDSGHYSCQEVRFHDGSPLPARLWIDMDSGPHALDVTRLQESPEPKTPQIYSH